MQQICLFQANPRDEHYKTGWTVDQTVHKSNWIYIVGLITINLYVIIENQTIMPTPYIQYCAVFQIHAFEILGCI